MENEKLPPTERFSDRAGNYVKYRPSYPAAIISFFEQITGLQKNWAIADIGSGTGIFSEMLLKDGYRVWAIEPNKAMREEAEKSLTVYHNFTSIEGKAEQTSLTAASIDLITVAQAFHWMDMAASKKEFQRILKPGGAIALLWNIRLNNTPFLKALEYLKIKFGKDYRTTRMPEEKELATFFHPEPLTRKDFYHDQLLGYEALLGQLLSSSYIPLKGVKHRDMILELENIFSKYNENGFVKIGYETKVFVNK